MAAAAQGHLDICQWLFEYGGDAAKDQINQERRLLTTPLREAYLAWSDGRDQEGTACRWFSKRCVCLE